MTRIGELLAGIKSRHNFLDIGAGSGALIIPLSQSFQHTTIVEPNHEQTAYFKH